MGQHLQSTTQNATLKETAQEPGNAASGACTVCGQVTLDKSCILSEYVYITSSQATSHTGVGGRDIPRICCSFLIIVSTICLPNQTVSLKTNNFIHYFFCEQLTRASHHVEHLAVNQINTCGHNREIGVSCTIFVVFIQMGWDCTMYRRTELASCMHAQIRALPNNSRACFSLARETLS